MNVTILIVHGSRDPKWRKPFESFTDNLRAQLGNDGVYLCYMEIAHPRLEDICKTLYEKGIKHANLVPLFMASGGHVDKDIPKQVQDVEAKFEGFKITTHSPIGEHPRIVSTMQSIISDLCQAQ